MHTPYGVRCTVCAARIFATTTLWPTMVRVVAATHALRGARQCAAAVLPHQPTPARGAGAASLLAAAACAIRASMRASV